MPDLPGLAEGTGKLKGRFVDVSLQSPNVPQSGYPIADEPGRQYFYDVADPRFAQVNAYVRHRLGAALPERRSASMPANARCPTASATIRPRPMRSGTARTTPGFRLRRTPFISARAEFRTRRMPTSWCTSTGTRYSSSRIPRWGCLSGTQCEMRAMGEGFSDYLAAVVHASRGNPALPGRPRRLHRRVGQHGIYQSEPTVHLSTLSAASGWQQGLSDRPGRRDIRRRPDLVGRIVGYPERDRRQRCDADRSRAPLLAPQGCDHAAGRAGNGRRRRRPVRRIQRDSACAKPSVPEAS